MTTASFSSISFESELAKRFKKLSRQRNESHSETLIYLMDSDTAKLKRKQDEIDKLYFTKIHDSEKR